MLIAVLQLGSSLSLLSREFVDTQSHPAVRLRPPSLVFSRSSGSSRVLGESHPAPQATSSISLTPEAFPGQEEM
jgi:hypothetical protein